MKVTRIIAIVGWGTYIIYSLSIECRSFSSFNSEGNTSMDWFSAGILLQTIWIALTEKHIGVQPMSQIIEEKSY